MRQAAKLFISLQILAFFPQENQITTLHFDLVIWASIHWMQSAYIFEPYPNPNRDHPYEIKSLHQQFSFFSTKRNKKKSSFLLLFCSRKRLTPLGANQLYIPNKTYIYIYIDQDHQGFLQSVRKNQKDANLLYPWVKGILFTGRSGP